MRPNFCLFWCVNLKLKSYLLAFGAFGLLGMGVRNPQSRDRGNTRLQVALGSGDIVITV